MGAARRKSKVAVGEPPSGVFERHPVEADDVGALGFALPDLGNILTGFQANLNWLESVFSAEFQREDVLEALQDLRDAQERLMWMCREAAVITSPSTIDIVPVVLDFVPLFEEALKRLEVRYGVVPALEISSMPTAQVCVDHELVIRAIERIVDLALQMTRGGKNTEIRGFVDGEQFHFVAIAHTVDRSDHRSTKMADEAAGFGVAINFCGSVARLHDGRMHMRKSKNTTVLHWSLPLASCFAEDDEDDSE